MNQTPLTLDAHLRLHDQDRWLSSRFVADPEQRARLVGLYCLDEEWARVSRLVKTPLAGEIRLAWWRDAVEGFAGGGPAEHPALAALGVGTARDLESQLQAVIEARHADLQSTENNEIAAHGLMSAAARLLDRASSPEVLRAAAHAWVSRHRHAIKTANGELKQLSANAFPAVAHVTLVRCEDRTPGDLERRTRITLAVLRGRL